jgi:HEAT repeat protein
MTAAVLLIATLLDPAATVAQRHDACFALRGDRSPEVVDALQRALADKVVRTCVARDLREAGAVGSLIAALSLSDADVQLAASRELGELRDPRALAALGRTALDANVMVAAAAIAALGAYDGQSAVPYLLAAARQPNVAGMNALEQAARLRAPEVLPIARNVLEKGDIAARLLAITILGDLGDQTDLPNLQKIAAASDPVFSRGRGFGFMPPIDLARAAQNAIARITSPR